MTKFNVFHNDQLVGSIEAADARSARRAWRKQSPLRGCTYSQLVHNPDTAVHLPHVPATSEDVLKAIREHAVANYERDGWDFLVECWSDDEILEEIGNRKAKAAIAHLRKIVRAQDEQRRAAQNEAF